MKVKIQTMLGDIIVRLYDETPIHRDNFMKLLGLDYVDLMLIHWPKGLQPQAKECADAPFGVMHGEDLLFRREVEITKDGILQDSGSERVVQLSLPLWRN